MNTVDAIDTDLPCVTCGYNLRTLGVDAVCPECATSVSMSIASPESCSLSAQDAARFVRILALLPLCIAIEAILVIQMQVVYLVSDDSARTAFRATWNVRWYGHAFNRFLLGICGALAYLGLPASYARKPRRIALALAATSAVSALASLSMFQFPGRVSSLTPPAHIDPKDALYAFAELTSTLSWWLVLALLLAASPVRVSRIAAMAFGAFLILIFSFSELANSVSMAAMSAFPGSDWPTRFYVLVCNHGEWWNHIVYPMASMVWLVLFWALVSRVQPRCRL